MSDYRRALSATGLALIAIGAVAFVLGLVSSWLNVRQPIASLMAIGVGLAVVGAGLMAVNRPGDREGASGPR